MSTVDGSCLCRRVRFSLTPPSNWVAHCHCSMCRKAHGAAYVTWVSVPADRFRLTAGAEEVSRYRSSEAATRSFCRTCGTSFLFESTRWAGEVHVALASLDQPIDRAPQVHAFFSDRAEWVRVDDGLPRRGGLTGTEPLDD